MVKVAQWITVAVDNLPALKPGRVIRVIRVNRVSFSQGHPGLTRIGSREKRNCSFDDVETYKRYRVALS